MNHNEHVDLEFRLVELKDVREVHPYRQVGMSWLKTEKLRSIELSGLMAHLHY